MVGNKALANRRQAMKEIKARGGKVTVLDGESVSQTVVDYGYEAGGEFYPQIPGVDVKGSCPGRGRLGWYGLNGEKPRHLNLADLRISLGKNPLIKIMDRRSTLVNCYRQGATSYVVLEEDPKKGLRATVFDLETATDPKTRELFEEKSTPYESKRRVA